MAEQAKLCKMASQLPSDPTPYKQRRRALRQPLFKNGAQLNGALVFSGAQRSRNFPANLYPYRSDSHFLYLSGLQIPNAALWLGAEQSILFATEPPPDDALWHGPSPGSQDWQKASGVDEVRPFESLGAFLQGQALQTIATLPCCDYQTRGQQRQWLKREWADLNNCSMSQFDQVLATAMVRCRSIHDELALSEMRHAARITHAAHLRGMASTKVDRSEAWVRAEMEAELIAQQAEPAYGSIVTTEGQILHAQDSSNIMQDGDLLLVDVGAEVNGWASDVTRTWPVNGRFSPSQRSIYDIVLAAQVQAIEAIKPGARYRDIHLLACKTLTQGLVDEGLLRGEVESLVERGAHALFFPHGVGHLIGLDVHDMEDLGDLAGYEPGRLRSDQFGLAYLRCDRDLQPGMMVTIEPGIYFVPEILNSPTYCADFDSDGTLNRDALKLFSDVRGIRIEDDVLCTNSGPDVFSASIPKAADKIEAQVGIGR